jgi:hypothetical protein
MTCFSGAQSEFRAAACPLVGVPRTHALPPAVSCTTLHGLSECWLRQAVAVLLHEHGIGLKEHNAGYLPAER